MRTIKQNRAKKISGQMVAKTVLLVILLFCLVLAGLVPSAREAGNCLLPAAMAAHTYGLPGKKAPQESIVTAQLTAPDQIGTGDAFMAEAKVTAGTPKVFFLWRGKTYSAETEEWDGSTMAYIILPVSLEEKASQLELAIALPDMNGKPGQKLARKQINVFAKKRPEQKLSVQKKYVEPPVAVQERIKNDREKQRKALASTLPKTMPHRLWSMPFLRPVGGDVSSLFGLKRVFNGQPRGFHKGLDLRGAEGTPIHACADGLAVLVDDLYYSGNCVYLNHGGGVFTAYLHMSKINVRPGEMVKRGQVIGQVGSTGRVTGPHLHLTMFAQGTSVDIQPWLEKTFRYPEEMQAHQKKPAQKTEKRRQ